MKAFLGGLIIGGAAVALAYSYLPEPPAVHKAQDSGPALQTSASPQPEVLETDMFGNPVSRWDGPWPGTSYNGRLGKVITRGADTPEEAGKLPPDPNAGKFFVSFSSPSFTLTRDDLQAVCLEPIGGLSANNSYTGISTNIFLTPDARRRFAAELARHDGEEVSIQFEGTLLNRFIADREKAENLASNSDIYSDQAAYASGAKLNTTRNPPLALPDFYFTYYYSNITEGLHITRGIANDISLTSCHSDLDLATFPGYVNPVPNWDDIANQ